MPTNTPTVLVKKADGTFARMTLDEIKKMRSAGPSAIPVKVGIQATGSRIPVRDDKAGQKFPSAIAVRDDKRTQTPPPQPVKSTISQPRVNQVEEVLKKIRFQVPEQLQNRLRSIIQLHLKDIRSAEQTKDKVMQPVLEGGLALNENEAGELVSICGIILTREAKNSNLSDVPVLKKKNLLPMVEPEEIPAIATPFNAFVHGEKGKTTKPVIPVRDPGSGGQRLDSRFRGNDNSVLSMKPATKVAMEDVQAPRPVEMGPVEEIQYITLVDFRRLSAKPIEAAARLKQKFLNLRDESVVLYLDALAAWHKSPLYVDYMKNVARALKEKRKMSALESGDANKIKLEEILAIVNMEKELE